MAERPLMAGEDPAYISWVHSRACMLVHIGGCGGPIQAHHPRSGAGTALRGHDHTAIPLCREHHIYDLHGLAAHLNDAPGFFIGLTRDERRAWEADAIKRTRALYESLGDPGPCPF